MSDYRIFSCTSGDVSSRWAEPQRSAAGRQLIGRPLDEQGALNAGLAIEQRAGFVAKPDRWW